MTELTGRDEVMVRSLSAGNRQRLLLAKTTINDPHLLILDEPSSGLDPRARVEVREILQELAGWKDHRHQLAHSGGSGRDLQ
ncbi:MAG: ATP-binding cassette domain-containing protein [Verrucomicrobiales bacterium]